MSVLVEKFRHPGYSRAIGRFIAVTVTALLLIYYCVHPDLYNGERNIQLFQSRKTYAMAGMSILLMSLLMTPNHLSVKWNQILSWIWFAVAPLAVYFSLYYMNAEKFAINFFELNKIAVAFTFVFLYLLQSILFCITGSIRYAVVIYAVAIAALGIANCFVISFRGMALSAADLFSVETAMTVASEYTYELDWYMFTEIFCTFIICVISLKLKGGRMAIPAVRVLLMGMCAVLGFGYYYICCETDFLEDHDIRSQGFTHQLRYKEFDMLFTTLCTCFYLSADKPDDYSLDRVKEIAAEYLDAAAGSGTSDNTSDYTAVATTESQQPNLIVIMNESFADYSDIGKGLDLSEDCMPFIHSLTENTIKGTAYASIYGGNTPNSEYEFLTGNTMAFLPASSVGFNLFVRGDMPSLASQYSDAGYYALAMHPYRGYNYRRHIVYPQIGFDNYYNRDDFSNPAYIRSYISDKSLFDRIRTEFRLNRRGSSPFFSYNVTMQNHSGYSASNQRNLGNEIQVLNPEVDQTKTNIYVNLIKETDKAFESLVNYFKEVKDPTIILMFGDHQANLGEDTYEYLLGDESQLTQEELMEKYKVPFIIWANYDIEEEVIEQTSINYLYSIMADRLGLSMTGYQKYLLDLRSEIPVINTLGYWGADGNFYELEDESSPYYEKIQEYHVLEYNYIFGKEDRYMEFFANAS